MKFNTCSQNTTTLPKTLISTSTKSSWKDPMNANITTVIRNSLLDSHWGDIFPPTLLQSNSCAWFVSNSSLWDNTWRSTPTFTQAKSLSSAHTKDAPRPSDKLANSPCTRNSTKIKSSSSKRSRESNLLWNPMKFQTIPQLKSKLKFPFLRTLQLWKIP